MLKRIVIIGASKNQLPLIKKAKEMGYETHVFAWKTGELGEKEADYFYPISITKRLDILEACKKIKPIAVISIASNAASATASFIARELGIPANSDNVFLCTLNKNLMRDKLKKAGIKQPGYVVVGDDFDLSAIDKLQFPLIVKPNDRSNSMGLKLVENQDNVFEAVVAARLLSIEGQAIIEEYICGFELFCETISFNGEHKIICYSNVISTGSPRFTVHEISQPADFHGLKKRKLDSIIENTLNALGIEYGASHIKIIVKKDDVYVLRISASMASNFIGSELVPLSTNVDYLKAVVDIGCGKEPKIEKKETRVLSKLRYIMDEKDKEILRNIQEGILHISNEKFFITVERPKEMGGYLPLELSNKGERFTGDLVHRFNSVRTAIWYVLKSEDTRRVWIPAFYSSLLKKDLVVNNFEVLEYHIDRQFNPIDINYMDEDMVILVNYYGVIGKTINAVMQRFPKTIVDNSFAFYEKPIMDNHRYTVYSCRRFFGVPDGAYLIGNLHHKINLEKDISFSRMEHLLKSAEFQSSNCAKKISVKNEISIGKKHLYMSDLTKMLLSSIDYESIFQVRKNNYKILNTLLKDYQKLDLPEECCAQCYPLMCDGRVRLILNKYDIHIPLLWRNVLESESPDSWEYQLADNVVALPIDQRYVKKDMEYLAHIVKNIMSTL